MKKVCTLVGAAVLIGGLETATLSADESRHSGAVAGTTEYASTLVSEDETITGGTISKIDSDTGKVEVKTARGTAEIYGDPELFEDLHEGERVTIELEPASGTVSKVDHTTGMVEVKTAQGISKLSFTPKAVKDLKEGEPVAVDVESADKKTP